MEGDKERKDARLMSSLIDLKLDTVKAEPVYEEVYIGLCRVNVKRGRWFH